MKRIAVGLVAALALLAVIVVTRASLVAAPQPLPKPASLPELLDADTIAQHLAAAIRFPTVSYGDGIKEKEKDAALEEMRSWLEATYPAFHKAATREVIGESLLFTWPGKNPDAAPVLLMGHMDVVPVVPGSEKDWAHAPFSGDIADGFVWGRGATDDKASVIAILEAAEALASSGFTPDRTILFAFGQDEEVGGNEGAAAIAKTLAARGTHAAWVLDEGPAILTQPYPGVTQPVAFIAAAEKGYLSLELTAHGNGGHSARPSNNLALPRLASAILAVRSHPFETGMDDIQREKFAALAPYVPFRERIALANLWLMEPLVVRQIESAPETAATLHTTISPTMLQAGVKENVIPSTASAVINFRLHPRDTIASVTEHVRRAIDDPAVDIAARKETVSEATKGVPSTDPAYRLIARTLTEVYGVPVAPEIMTGATDARHYAPIADAVLRTRPLRSGPGDAGRVHGTNERTAAADLAPLAEFYMRLIQEAK